MYFSPLLSPVYPRPASSARRRYTFSEQEFLECQLDLALKKVAVLYARSDSVYKSLPECDVYDMERDARTYDSDLPVIAHPPCRAWGRLKAFAKPRPDEKELAYHAIEQVRRCGGVLEHPAHSSLWKVSNLPAPGEGSDAFGGFTFPIMQSWFGHKAPKATWLYIVGIKPDQLPTIPFHLGTATGRICNNGSKKFREGTPFELAQWLITLCELIRFTYNNRNWSNGLDKND